MAKTLEELRRQLSAIEPDEATYSGIGPEDLPLLEQLARDPEPWMASRAVFAASRMADVRAKAILARAAGDPRSELRVAAAAATKNLAPAEANSLLLQAMNDSDLGVRKFAVQAVAPTHSEPVQARLRELESADPAPAIREAAKSRLAEIRRIR
jgi:HEAT repeat protein